MIIIQMMGGLGNQMFQYALYSQLKSMGKIVKVDEERGFKEDAQRNPALSVFGITYERASRAEVIKMRDSSPALAAKVRRKLFGRRNHSYFEESKLFIPGIFKCDNIYLEGYWQSEKYFPDVGKQLRSEFSLEHLKRYQKTKSGLSDEAERYLWKIEQTKSVSIHFRRGDYLLPQNQALFGHICTEAYYEHAIQVMARRYPGCIFYLFTNDLKWAQSWLDGRSQESNKYILVELSREKDYESLLLMSKCKHNILANSSFSWWASYLNNNPGKTIIAPEKWMNGYDCRDIYRADMIKLDVDM